MIQIKLGYCCVSTLHNKLKVSRCSTKTYLDSHDAAMCHDYLLDKAKKNIQDLILLLYENKKNAIFAYRVPEQVLPQIDLGYYQIEELHKELEEAGKVANALDMQLSTHPSQFFVLNSLREDVVIKTVDTLNIFADIFAAMKLERVPNMTLHVGVKNAYPSAYDATDAFCKNYERLNENAKRFLVLENDQVSFCVEDCLRIHEQIGVPVVFDNKHYEWNPGKLSYEDALNVAVHTWSGRVPKLHLSSDKEGKKHAHADYVALADYRKMEKALIKSKIPACYVMLECKEKDRAVLRLMEEIRK